MALNLITGSVKSVQSVYAPPAETGRAEFVSIRVNSWHSMHQIG